MMCKDMVRSALHTCGRLPGGLTVSQGRRKLASSRGLSGRGETKWQERNTQPGSQEPGACGHGPSCPQTASISVSPSTGRPGPRGTPHPPLFKLRPRAIEDLAFPCFIHPRGQYSVHIAQSVSSAQRSEWAGGPQNGWREQMGLGPGGSPCHLLLWATPTLFSLQAAMREGGQQQWNHLELRNGSTFF